MHRHRADRAAVAAYLSLADVDRLVTASGIRTPFVRIVRDGAVVPPGDYTAAATLAGAPITGLVDARKALALYAAGATIVLQGLHRYWPALTELVARLESELGHPAQANAYLTPAGAQGFAVHSDTHDVFVLQTAGRKHWEIHGPAGVEELVLEAGDCLYLPTGTPHAARAQESTSLHVTVGVTQLTWRGLVRRSVADALAAVPDEHLPAGFLDDPALLTGRLADELGALAGRIRGIDPARAAGAEVTRVLTTRPTRVAGGLLDLAHVDGLADDTPLVRRAGVQCVLAVSGDRLHVLLGDRRLEVPLWLRPALELVREAEFLTPHDLASALDGQSRIVLCRRLVREGLLRVSQ